MVVQKPEEDDRKYKTFFNVVDFPNWCPSEIYTYPYKFDHVTFEYDPVTYVFR